MRRPAPRSSVTTTDGSFRSPSSRRMTEWGAPRWPPTQSSGGLRVPDVAMQSPLAGGPLPDDDVLDVHRGALAGRWIQAERRLAHLARGVTVDVEVDGLQRDVPEAHVLDDGRPQLSDACL